MLKRIPIALTFVSFLMGIGSAEEFSTDDFPEFAVLEMAPELSATRGGVRYSEMEIAGSIFYPVGWSRNGKFAYFSEYASADSWNTVREYVIQDMTNDEVLYAMGMAGGSRERLSSEFLRKCEELGISLEGSVLLPLPLVVGDTAYSAHLEGFIFEDKGPSHGDTLGQFLVRMLRSDGTTKIVHEYAASDEQLFDVRILGCVRSPFQSRIAVALARIAYKDGTNNLATSVYFVGAHLVYGFEPYGIRHRTGVVK